jgi:hypothetical protein
MFPTRATQAGNHALDSKLEDFSTEKLARWKDRKGSEIVDANCDGKRFVVHADEIRLHFWKWNGRFARLW